MGGAIKLRQDFGADELRRFAAKAKDGAQARRLLALAAVHDGMNRTEAARIGGMDRPGTPGSVNLHSIRSPLTRAAIYCPLPGGRRSVVLLLRPYRFDLCPACHQIYITFCLSRITTCCIYPLRERLFF